MPGYVINISHNDASSYLSHHGILGLSAMKALSADDHEAGDVWGYSDRGSLHGVAHLSQDGYVCVFAPTTYSRYAFAGALVRSGYAPRVIEGDAQSLEGLWEPLNVVGARFHNTASAWVYAHEVRKSAIVPALSSIYHDGDKWVSSDKNISWSAKDSVISPGIVHCVVSSGVSGQAPSSVVDSVRLCWSELLSLCHAKYNAKTIACTVAPQDKVMLDALEAEGSTYRGLWSFIFPSLWPDRQEAVMPRKDT